MRLSRLLQGVEVLQLEGPLDPDVREINFNSSNVQVGDLFVAVPGTQVDGHTFIPSAIERGAAVIVCERLGNDLKLEVTYVRVASASHSLGLIANAFHGQPSERIVLVGVTGTNGKTTTATLLYRLLTALGHRCGLLSTIRNYIGPDIVPSTHTTGDAIQIATLMARMVASDCTHCFMEVTSHAIHQNRISGLLFDGAIFTNLTHDHLDYHKTLEAYRDAKKSWFDGLPATAFALTNIDDPVGAFIVRDTAARRVTYGTLDAADIHLELVKAHARGLELNVSGTKIASPLVGEFNAYNLTAVYAAAILIGAEQAVVATKLSELNPVEGRMERVNGPRSVTAIVDFAHTPDALQKVLTTLRGTNPSGFIICVVGCGGDRDKDKRPAMAKIAARSSDQVILTTDNPRFEDPQAILDQMFVGVPEQLRRRVTVILDRREAIEVACAAAPDGAMVLIAGRGHEKYQEIAGERRPFDDIECVRAALAR